MLHSKFNQNFSPFIWNFSLILKKYICVFVCECVHLFRERLMWVREKSADAGNTFFFLSRFDCEKGRERYRSEEKQQQKLRGKWQAATETA